MLMSLGAHVHLGFRCAQLYDPFLSFLKGLYLYEELAVDLSDRFSLAFGGVTMNSGQLSFAVRQGPLFTQCHCKSATRWMRCPQRVLTARVCRTC